MITKPHRVKPIFFGYNYALYETHWVVIALSNINANFQTLQTIPSIESMLFVWHKIISGRIIVFGIANETQSRNFNKGNEEGQGLIL